MKKQPEPTTPPALPASPVMQQAVAQFGQDRANGIFTELLKTWGPIFGPMLLKLILGLSQQQALVPPEASAAPIVIGSWIASVLRANREAFLAVINSQIGVLYDAGCDALDGAPTPA